MRRVDVLCTGAAAALALLGPAFAQGSAPAATTPPAGTTPAAVATPPAPAAPPTSPSVRIARHLTGEIVSVNPDAKTLTVKHGPRGREVTFVVEGDAAAHLADFKTGDVVKIGFGHTKRQLVARDIVKSQVAKAK